MPSRIIQSFVFMDPITAGSIPVHWLYFTMSAINLGLMAGFGFTLDHPQQQPASNLLVRKNYVL
jgi:hypothetical protein